MFLVLDEDAQDAALELPESDITGDEGIDKIVARLDQLYLKDRTQQAYEAYEAFETYKRPNDTNITNFVNEFEKRHSKTKSFGTTMSSDILAYRLLKSANLSEHNEQLAKATITELTYDKMKMQLKKIFGATASPDNLADEIKVESVNSVEEEYTEDTLFGRSYNSQRGQYGQYQSNLRGNYSSRSRNRSNSVSFPRNYSNNPINRKKGRNPLDQYGNVTTCAECNSVNHWISNCPDRNMLKERSNQEVFVQENLLRQAIIPG